VYDELGRIEEEVVLASFAVLSWYLAGMTVEGHEKPQ
jgi:hypothetical protein